MSDPLSPDPGVGRFISNDPISYAGGLNLHVYAPNPISWIDPTGLASSGRWEPAQAEYDSTRPMWKTLISRCMLTTNASPERKKLL
ncbi:MAG: RHS repeat-associated core domain-containing protein [Janthinobacterium lividum]